MKDFEVELRVRNNHLKERREALGMSQHDLADAAGVPHHSYNAYETLRRSPRRRRDGGWRHDALRLARFHCVEPEDLFPQAVLAIEASVAVRKLSGEDIYPLLSAHHERLIESPEAAFERAELLEQMRRALESLPPRSAEALRLRFGLDDGVERTLDEVGETMGVSGARVRQIELRALRMLRHPSRSGAIREALDP